MPWYSFGRGRRVSRDRQAPGDAAPVDLSPAQGFADPVPAPLPGWRRRAGSSSAAETGTAAAHPRAAGRSDAALVGDEAFRPNRRAARYAPADASFELDRRALTLLTISMSGLSMRWDAARMPAVGSSLSGDIRPDSLAEAFPASIQVVRLEPGDRLVAGRFVGLRGSAMDQLLDWLVHLERETAQPEP